MQTTFTQERLHILQTNRFPGRSTNRFCKFFPCPRNEPLVSHKTPAKEIVLSCVLLCVRPASYITSCPLVTVYLRRIPSKREDRSYKKTFRLTSPKSESFFPPPPSGNICGDMMHRSHKQRLYSGLWYWSNINERMENSRYPFKKVHERIGIYRRLFYVYRQSVFMKTSGNDKGSRPLAIIYGCIIGTISVCHEEFVWLRAKNSNSSS